MNLLVTALSATVFAAIVVSAQIPGYSSNEDYCAKNPNAITCKDGKPIDMHVLTPGSEEWCDKYPDGWGCKNGKPNPNQWGAAPKTTVPKAVTPRAASPAPSTPVAPPADYRLPAPACRTKGSSLDIRLGELDWRLLQPQSDILIGMNLGSLLQSELARTLIRDLSGKIGATADEQEKLLAGLGNVTQAVISIHQKEVLAVLVGNLDDFPEGSQIGDLQSLRVSADTVILGSPDALRWALQRQKFGLLVTSQLTEAQQLNQTYHFWAWAKPAGLAALGQGVSNHSPVTKIKLGATLKDGFRMDVLMDTADAMAAKRFLETSRKNVPRDLQASVEGASVHYSLVLDRSATLARFASLTDGVGTQFAPLLAAARQISAGKAPDAVRKSPGKIVIEGLDDGPKEVPLSQKN